MEEPALADDPQENEALNWEENDYLEDEEESAELAALREKYYRRRRWQILLGIACLIGLTYALK